MNPLLCLVKPFLFGKRCVLLVARCSVPAVAHHKQREILWGLCTGIAYRKRIGLKKVLCGGLWRQAGTVSWTWDAKVASSAHANRLSQTAATWSACYMSKDMKVLAPQ